MELACILLFPLVQFVRLSAGSSGNRSEALGPMFLMLGLSAPVLTFFIYFLTFQIYVYVLASLLHQNTRISRECPENGYFCASCCT
jgi:hypothetical protein